MVGRSSRISRCRFVWRKSAVSGSLTIILVLFAGCSAFQSSKRIDLGPFADNTSVMFADAQKVSRPFTWIYLKPYQNVPEVAETRAKAMPILKSLRAVLMYSNQLVALNSSSFTEKQRNDRLASYLYEATRSAVSSGKIAEVGLNPSGLDTVFMDIRKGETFLEGIRAASPLVNAIVATMDQNLTDLQDGLSVTLRAIETRIETENTETRINVTNLQRLQNQFVREATLLYDYSTGTESALDSIFQMDASMKELAASAKKKSLNVADEIERELAGRASHLRSYKEQLQPEVDLYLAKQKELEELRVAFETRIKLARGAMMVWGQSHRNLGEGIAVPPLIDVAGTVGGLIGGAAKTVVP